MYEELVKELRESKPNRRLAYTAADAIEALDKGYQMMAEAYEYEVTKPRWISVEEEHLPDEPGEYNVYIRDPEITPEFDLSFVTSAFFNKDEGLWKVETNDFYCADLRGVNREKVYHITHWRPLPEPPGREADGF